MNHRIGNDSGQLLCGSWVKSIFHETEFTLLFQKINQEKQANDEKARNKTHDDCFGLRFHTSKVGTTLDRDENFPESVKCVSLRSAIRPNFAVQ